MAAWHHLAVIDVATTLATDPERGLAGEAARARLAADGPNTLPAAVGLSAWRLFLGQFRGVMTVLLLAATGIALLLGDVVEAAAIAVVLLLNGLLGFVNEYRAEQSMEALRALEVPLASVLRDGTTREVPSADLVSGDVVVLETGDRVPADGRLIESWSLRLDESTLTGESLAADKNSAALQTGAGRPPPAFIRSIVAQGASIAAATLLAFGWALTASNDLARATTVAFLTLGLAQLFHVFNSRTLDDGASGRGLFGNRYIWLAVAITLAAQLLAVYMPGLRLVLGTVAPSPSEWLVVGASALAPSLLVEAWRWVGRRRVHP